MTDFGYRSQVVELFGGPLDGWIGQVIFMPVITLAVPTSPPESYTQNMPMPMPQAVRSVNYRFDRFKFKTSVNPYGTVNHTIACYEHIQ